MRRKLVTILLLVMSAAILAAGASACGEAGSDGVQSTVHGVQYTLCGSGEDAYYSVSGYDGDGGSVAVISSYNGREVTVIESFALTDCTSITSLTLGESVTTIGNFAFLNCNALTEVTIPASVTAINIGAFDGCKSLKTVNYGGTAEQWAAITIAERNSALTGAAINYSAT